MNYRFVPRLATAAAITLMTAGAAQAAVSILGGGFGRECYLSAELKRDTRSGLAVCTRAIEEESLPRRDRAATYVNRGIIHMHARDLDAAVRDYEQAIRMQPALAEAHVNLGIALLHKGGNDQAAIAALTHGLGMSPSRPEVAYYTRAVAHELVGNVRAAYEDYQAAAAAKPGWADPHEQLKRFSVERRRVANG
jgi:tetratricopeptide (TPR) repeat protein